MNIEDIQEELKVFIPTLSNMPGTLSAIAMHTKELNRLIEIVNEKSETNKLELEIKITPKHKIFDNKN